MNHITAGLTDHHTEFFAVNQEPFLVSNGRVLSYDQFPEALLNSIDAKLRANPAMLQAYWLMGCYSMEEVNKKFLVCNYGKCDHVPDMVDGELQKPEYWACPERGRCKHEGVGCVGLATQSGEYLTRREIQYIVLTAKGALDKTIADELKIEYNTVTTHSKNVRRKLGLQRKADITRFAYQNNLISCLQDK